MVVDRIFFLGDLTIWGCRRHWLVRSEDWDRNLEPSPWARLEDQSWSEDDRWRGDGSGYLPGSCFRDMDRFTGVSLWNGLPQFRNVRLPLFFGNEVFLLNPLYGVNPIPVVTVGIAGVRRR